MDLKLLLAGIGGQGILFATKVLSETAVALGYDVIGSETHGMSQRGGSVVSHLKVGPYHSPLVRQGTADFLLAFDRDEAFRHLPFLGPGGVCFVKAAEGVDAEVADQLRTLGVEMLSVDADAIARDVGVPRAANVALVGFALAHPGFPFPYPAVQQALARLSSERFRASNLEALARGYAAGSRAFR